MISSRSERDAAATGEEELTEVGQDLLEEGCHSERANSSRIERWGAMAGPREGTRAYTRRAEGSCSRASLSRSSLPPQPQLKSTPVRPPKRSPSWTPLTPALPVSPIAVGATIPSGASHLSQIPVRAQLTPAQESSVTFPSPPSSPTPLSFVPLLCAFGIQQADHEHVMKQCGLPSKARSTSLPLPSPR